MDANGYLNKGDKVINTIAVEEDYIVLVTEGFYKTLLINRQVLRLSVLVSNA